MKPYIKPNDDRDYTDTIQFQKKKHKQEFWLAKIEYHC